MQNGTGTLENTPQFLIKLNAHLPCGSDLFLDIQVKQKHLHRKPCIVVFTPAEFTFTTDYAAADRQLDKLEHTTVGHTAEQDSCSVQPQCLCQMRELPSGLSPL
jgi:hypothetical protein